MNEKSDITAAQPPSSTEKHTVSATVTDTKGDQTMHNGVNLFEESIQAKGPDVFYFIPTKEFLFMDIQEVWMPMTEAQMKRVLRQYGVSARADQKTGLSAQDEFILRIQQERNVAWAGPLAGYKSGIHTIDGTRILVTRSPRILAPVAGDWSMLRGVIEGILGADDGKQVQFFLAWLKISYETLRAGKLQPGQVVVFCGPHGCGKSLLQHIITAVLGGRAAKPYQAMSGGTAFNADLFGAEHLMVEDEYASTDLRTRRYFGAQIKSVAVNEGQRLHAKNRDAILLKPFWRLSVSLNDEPENVMVLPPIDESLVDKIMIFKARQHEMPMSTRSGQEREAFWKKLASQIPAMLHDLVATEIPVEMRSERFGVTHFHHPEIIESLDAMAPESRLLALIDSSIFNDRYRRDSEKQKIYEPFEGTAEELQSMLLNYHLKDNTEAKQVFSWFNSCGFYLGRLAKKRPNRVQSIRKANARLWRILPPSEEAPVTSESTPVAKSSPQTPPATGPTAPASDGTASGNRSAA